MGFVLVLARHLLCLGCDSGAAVVSGARLLVLALALCGSSAFAVDYACKWGNVPGDTYGAAMPLSAGWPANPYLVCAPVGPDGLPLLAPNCPGGSVTEGGGCYAPGNAPSDVAAQIAADAAAAGTPPPVVPPPFVPSLFMASLALAAALLGGVSVIVGAPTIVAAGAASSAIAFAVAALPGFLSGANAGLSLNSPEQALTVNLVPSGSAVPAPVSGDTSAPSVVMGPTGAFHPGGGGLFTGNGATGGWIDNTGGASGSWDYVPAPTVANPQPGRVAAVSADGSTMAVAVGAISGSHTNQVLGVQRAPDGTLSVARSANIPVTDSSGNQTTASVFSVSQYVPTTGSNVPADAVLVSGVNAVYIAPVLGNGQASNGGTGITPMTSGGTGGGGTGSGGTGTGSGMGSGSCTSGDCATESTQLANKGLLTSINHAFQPGSADVVLPDVASIAQIQAAGLSGSGGAFAGLAGWAVPAHTSVCPTPTFVWQGTTYAFSAHCGLVNDHFGALRAMMIVMFGLSAVFTVLRA